MCIFLNGKTFFFYFQLIAVELYEDKKDGTRQSYYVIYRH